MWPEVWADPVDCTCVAGVRVQAREGLRQHGPPLAAAATRIPPADDPVQQRAAEVDHDVASLRPQVADLGRMTPSETEAPDNYVRESV